MAAELEGVVDVVGKHLVVQAVLLVDPQDQLPAMMQISIPRLGGAPHSGLEAAGRPNQDFFYLFLEKYLCLFLF